MIPVSLGTNETRALVALLDRYADLPLVLRAQVLSVLSLSVASHDTGPHVSAASAEAILVGDVATDALRGE